MTDPFTIGSGAKRDALVAALLAYVGLFVAELATGDPLAAAAADLLLAVVVVPGSAVVVRRATAGGSTDELAVLAAAAFLLAGLTIGYEGLATLALVPRLVAVELLGSVALLAGVVLYLSHRR